MAYDGDLADRIREVPAPLRGVIRESAPGVRDL